MDRFADDVPTEVKKRRNNELLAIQGDVSAAIHAGYVGRTVEVFVERVSAKSQKAANRADPTVTLSWQQDEEVTQLSGRTDGDLIVMFDGDTSLIGETVEVEVTSAASLALFGSRVEAAVGV